jgi:hypothetical protein
MPHPLGTILNWCQIAIFTHRASDWELMQVSHLLALSNFQAISFPDAPILA